MTKVLYVPDRSAFYRLAFLHELVMRDPSLIVTVAADSKPGPDGVPVFGPSELESPRLNWISLRNLYFKGRCVLQRGLFHAVVRSSYDVIVLWGEAHRVSSWIALFGAKARGKPVVIWGHGIYGREPWWLKKVRALFYNQASLNFTYGMHGKQEMYRAGVTKPVTLIYNSLLSEAERKLLSESLPEKSEPGAIGVPSNHLRLIYVGRLIESKKLDLLARINPMTICGGNLSLTIIGEGPERSHLESLFGGRWGRRVDFLGPLDDFYEVARVISEHDIFVSPGNIGLAAIHSLMSGTPVITHDEASVQGPEYEVISEGLNGALFKRGSAEDLQAKISDCARSLSEGRLSSPACKKSTFKYSSEHQVEIFLKSLRTLKD